MGRGHAPTGLKNKEQTPGPAGKRILQMISILKREKVLSIALVLGILSCFWIPPDRHYLEYIDLRVLGLLFCLMLLVKGFQNVGLADLLTVKLFGRVSSSRGMCRTLILLCFFSSMLITNDVALITFVPFAILALKRCGQEKLIIRTVVLQTMAANLGSMLTPIGNPQNLYLFSQSGMSLGTFLKTMAPLALVSLALLLAAVLFLPEEQVQIHTQPGAGSLPRKETAVYSLLFLLNLLVVFRILSWIPVTVITVLAVVIIGRRSLLGQVDYCLLLTFVGFFVFVGNLGRVPAVSRGIAQILEGREILVSALFSQIVSNVPAALLLSGFTDRFSLLLVGTNVGGLGTLIASMASLISYKQYAESEHAEKGTYIKVFTLYNAAGLAALLFFSLWYNSL